MAAAADPKWLDRLLQTREQTKEEYYAWCDKMATSYMELAHTLEDKGLTVGARQCQDTARLFAKEMERILKDG